MFSVGAVSRAVLQQPARAWGSYIKQLDRHPITTKIATSVVAALIGDSIAQHVARPSSSKSNPAEATKWRYDWPRTARFCAFNGLMGCLGHFYYSALDRGVMVNAPKTAAAVLAKVVIDQLMFAPICTAIFYVYKCAAEGRPRELRTELHSKWLPTLKAGWMLWPAAHVLNFALVPSQHRILYINIVSVAGTFILSRAAAGDFSKRKKGPLERPPSPTEILFDGVSTKVE